MIGALHHTRAARCPGSGYERDLPAHVRAGEVVLSTAARGASDNRDLGLNASRAGAAANLFKTNVTNGILGSFKINAEGDTNSNPVSIYQIKGGKQTTYKVITPPTSLVKAA